MLSRSDALEIRREILAAMKRSNRNDVLLDERMDCLFIMGVVVAENTRS